MSRTAALPSVNDTAFKPLSKGQQTRAAIIDAALGLATQIGLDGLSIGALAEIMKMSKSGVFAHFGSREDLQVAVVEEYQRRFRDEVFLPALNVPRGVARLRELFQRWIHRTTLEIDSGCLYVSGAVEFEDQEGPAREALENAVQLWMRAVARAVDLARQTGEFRADVDPDQLTFEMHGLILTLHYQARFLRDPHAVKRALKGFDELLARACQRPTRNT